MTKKRNYRLKSKRIFIGLEVSKRTWKLCVRSERMLIHEAE
jgi:transposase